MSSRVRELSEKLMMNPGFLKIDYGYPVVRTAEWALKNKIELPTWDFAPFYPQSDDFEEMCQFYLTFNAINYCYFDHHGIRFREKDVFGATLTSLKLTERWDEIKDPLFLSNIDENYLLSELFFTTNNPISLVKERTVALREVGHFLNSNSDFSFEKLFKKYHSNAYLVSQVLPTFLPSWRDPFYKRAQLFVGMVYGRFQNWSDIPIDKKSLFDLTVFADYRVPQTLINLGIIKLKGELLVDYDKGLFIESGSMKELEIRAAAVVASDILMDEINKHKEEDINPLHVDYILWSAARKKKEYPDIFVLNAGHHHTITTDY